MKQTTLHPAALPRRALRDPAFRDMLADFIEKTTQDLNNLKQRVQELEQRLQR